MISILYNYCKPLLGVGFYTALILWISGCASTGNPTGGPRDLLPPVLDTLASSLDRQTNFKPKELIFLFDEFVEVRDPIKQVLVSPPLTYIPKVTHRGKKVTFAFDEKEVLRDDATYTINFGEAIVDFHEGNKLENFTYVFATGDQLDSLDVKGNIFDALTNAPDENMVIFLYDNLQDSAVCLERPFYFARPDKSGNFVFRNIKSDTFRIFAIKDENINYKYDLETEKIAFYDTLILLTDTFKQSIQLKSSLPTPILKIKSANAKTYGKINILCNTTPLPDVSYSISNSSILHVREVVGDSINIYYQTDLDSFNLYILGDTIPIKPPSFEDFNRKNSFNVVSSNLSMQMLPTDSIMISFNLPLLALPSDRFEIIDSIGPIENIDLSLSSDHKSLIIKYPWGSGEQYQLKIDSGAISNIYGQVSDSLDIKYGIVTQDKLASLKIIVKDLDSTSRYIIRVLKENLFVYQTSCKNKSQLEIVLTGLSAERYNVEIIEDKNSNGKWDPGNYWSKTQPEVFQLTKGNKLRENWETEFEVKWSPGPLTINEPISSPQGLNLNINQQSKK